MTVVVVNKYGILIDEYTSETESPTEALRRYLESQQPVLDVGDVIQIR